MNFSAKLKHVFTNPVFTFLSARYVSFLIHLLNAILITNALGPYYLGLYGFFMMLRQYFNYTNFGSQHALNVLLSVNSNSEERNKYITNSMMIPIGLIGFYSVLFILLKVSDLAIFPKYEYMNWHGYVYLIVILDQLNLLFVSVYRAYGRTNKMAFYYMSIPVGVLIAALNFTAGELLEMIFLMMIAASSISLVLFVNTKLFKINISNIRFPVVKKIMKQGISLLLYNVAVYLILISTRTIVSIFYDVQDMGIFSLAHQMSYAAIMFVSSISFVFLSKIISRVKEGVSNDKVKSFINYVRTLFVTFNYLVVLAVYFVFPFVKDMLDTDDKIINTFYFLMITQLTLSFTIGYSSLLIARFREKTIAGNAIMALVINIPIIIVISYYQVPLEYIALCTNIGTIIYAFLVNVSGRKLLNEENPVFETFREIFQIRYALFYLALIIMPNFDLESFYYLILIGLFTLFNLDKIVKVFWGIYGVLRNKSILEFD